MPFFIDLPILKTYTYLKKFELKNLKYIVSDKKLNNTAKILNIVIPANTCNGKITRDNKVHFKYTLQLLMCRLKSSHIKNYKTKVKPSNNLHN